jgi:hypothetical protein
MNCSNNAIKADPKKLRCAPLFGPVMAGVISKNPHYLEVCIYLFVNADRYILIFQGGLYEKVSFSFN